jgi:hypothetical protein
MKRIVLLAALLLAAGCRGTSPGATTAPTPATPSTPIPPATPAARAPHAQASYATWRLPYAIARAGVTPSGAAGWFIVAGGMLPGDLSTTRAIRVDLRTGHTRALPSVATPVHDVAAGTYAGLPALFGGGNATEQSVIQVLRGNAWKAATHLPTARSDLSVVQAAGRTLVIGGYDGARTPPDILAVGARGGLTRFGKLVVGVRYAATALVGTDAYVFGGEVDHRELDTVQRVDGRTGRTTIVARLPQPLGHAVAAYVGGRVLLIGGSTNPDTRTGHLWWFDPVNHEFTRAGRLPAALSDSAVAVLGHDVFLLGGESSSVTDRVVEIRVS